MRVGLIIYGSIDTISGGYLYDRELVGYLRSRGDIVEVISLPARSYLGHLAHDLLYRLPEGFDVIIEDELAHPSLIRANRINRSASTKGDPPVVSVVHNLHSSEHRPAWQNSIYRWIEARYLESVDGFVFNSEATRDSVTKLVGEGRPSVLAPPGGDRLGSIAKAELRRRTSRTGPLRLLFLANVTPLKGLHVLLEALENLPSGSCALDVVGSLDVDRTYSGRMQSKARALSIPVAFHGVLDGEALGLQLEQADVLVNPSFYEGFGIAFVEGMAFGLPAIGTTAGAMPRLIEDRVNGYLIPPGDATKLSQILQDLACDRKLLGRLSINARRRFEDFSTWEESAAAIRSFLVDLLRRRSSKQL